MPASSGNENSLHYKLLFSRQGTGKMEKLVLGVELGIEKRIEQVT